MSDATKTTKRYGWTVLYTTGISHKVEMVRTKHTRCGDTGGWAFRGRTTKCGESFGARDLGNEHGTEARCPNCL